MSLLTRTGTSPPAGGRLLYLDTETTGLAGGTGTYVFLVGAGFFDGDTFAVRQYFMRDLDEEPALLAAVGGLLGRFDGVVTHNGGGLTRCSRPASYWRAGASRRRFSPDLLGCARRLWSTRLADAAWEHSSDMRSASPEMMTFRALIPAAYFDYLRRKQRERFRGSSSTTATTSLSPRSRAGYRRGRPGSCPGLPS
jgi:uncharacterized protein YprB with RNaseH-like and TPR domain